ncbi:NADP-dependent oxidoreductase [Spirosoma endbachense]|uniref:Zinc-binding dehydrogenase n=1 Tax=Spirosoma endbachense TaxID=2666025 RepID=A0A6P1VZE8_9BACT|nr:NADP-dependent oxidoreductase [Spirosoma endbachense]QHV96776.1 zinc-binding dehydrogenase [Spirosoma endbachense]
MKAITLTDFGGVENLVLTELATPAGADNDVLVQVKAISVNPVDVKTRSGKGMSSLFKNENPMILGWDISGVVTESKSPLFKRGDEVFGMVNFPGIGKTYAEYVVAPASHLSLKPASISHQEAAAASLAALTAWQAIVSHAQVQAGQRVLIHAAAGGVGHFAVQIAKQLGAYVIGTASAANKEFVLSLGADEHIDYKAKSLADATQNIDFVLDTIGGENIDSSLEVMRKGGTIISIPSGKNEAVKAKAEAKGMIGFPIRVQSNGEDMQKLADLLADGRMKAHVSQTFAFDEMGKAHLQIETGKTQGKVAVLV